jgi:hypothetical protein
VERIEGAGAGHPPDLRRRLADLRCELDDGNASPVSFELALGRPKAGAAQLRARFVRISIRVCRPVTHPGSAARISSALGLSGSSSSFSRALAST